MKNKIKGQYRQGDVLVQRTDTIPEQAVKQSRVKGERIILAHGEATGHHHSILGQSADWWKGEPIIGDLAADQFVNIAVAEPLVHQEHGSIPIQPGKHIVRRQREYSPAALRNVQD